jgi:hypothetical protein
VELTVHTATGEAKLVVGNVSSIAKIEALMELIGLTLIPMDAMDPEILHLLLRLQSGGPPGLKVTS